MRLALEYWGRLAIWTGVLLVILVAITLIAGQGFAEVLAHLPGWAGLALALAAFPVGISVAPETFPDGRLVPRRVMELVLAAASVSVLMLTLGNVVGPAASRALSSESAMGQMAPASHMSLGQLAREAKAAAERAEASTAVEAVRQWQIANGLGYHFVRRTDGTLLPVLFGLIGVLAGFWSRRTPRWQIQQAQQWALGLFLLMSTYLAGENGYEMIAMRIAGPAYFAGDLVLVVPSILLLGLAWPTAMTLLGERV